MPLIAKAVVCSRRLLVMRTIV